MRRAALLAVLVTSGAWTGNEPALVTRDKPARTFQAVESRPIAALPGWEALWDRDTGVPVRITGSHIDVPGAIADPAIAERAARDFLATHLAVLAPGSSTADFVLVGNDVDASGIRTVGFAQLAGGLRVVGAQLGFVFAHDRLFAIGSDALPDVKVAPPPARVSLAAQAEGARAWLAAETRLAITAVHTGARVILPLVRAGGVEYRVVDVVAATADGGAWDVYVGADGAPIARASKLHFATGTLTYNAGVRYATGTRMDYPAREVAITVDGNATTTGIDGTFSFAGAGSVKPGLTGTRVQMVNAAGALVTTTLTAPNLAWNVMATEQADAQVSTYVYGNLIKARDRLINPTVAGWIDQSLDFHVNENQSCNAYSTGDDVHFFRKSGMCENTGRIADVVFHEFGHSFHNHSAIPGMGAFESNLSEGMGDFNAANLVEDSGIGRGFDFTDAPSREIDPVGFEAQYPRDMNADPHVSGLIISGALWDLRKAAILVLGHDAGIAVAETAFRGVLQRANGIGTSYTAALIADDDDGDLGNGTPHQCLIAPAFAPHGLVPNFVTTTVGTPVATGLSVSVPVMRPASGSCPPPGVTTATLTWQANGGAPADVALTAQGTNYVGAIPAQPDNTLVTYSILVTLDNGAQFAFPDNAADPKYQLWIGTTTPLYCASMDADPKWMQTNMHGMQWEWAAAGLEPTSGDPLAAHTGDHVLGLNLDFGGKYLANDTTRIETPAIDVSGYDHVRLQYWRWLTVERGLYDTSTIEINGTTAWTNAMDVDFSDKEWRFHDLDLTGMTSVTVAWTLASDNSGQYGGWTLDDVCLVGYPKHALCGDGIVDDGETCDDGNTLAGDGCSATCEDEHMEGGCCSTSRDPAGAIVLGLTVILIGTRRRRQTRA